MKPQQLDGTEARRPLSAQELLERYRAIRLRSEGFVDSLEPEDCVIQSMEDVSPTRWHLAHTTWFFETFLLRRGKRDYQPYHPAFEYLFNSYYNSVGKPFPRNRRGLLSRPTLEEVLEYRRQIDCTRPRRGRGRPHVARRSP